MENTSFKRGSIVISLCGRDKGRYFAITAFFDEQYGYIADGKLRTISKPKKKKVKHMKLMCHSDEIEEMLLSKTLTDRKMKDILNRYTASKDKS